MSNQKQNKTKKLNQNPQKLKPNTKTARNVKSKTKQNQKLNQKLQIQWIHRRYNGHFKIPTNVQRVYTA